MAEVLLQVDSVSKRFGGLLAVDKASFTAETSRITALIGPNGAGKTTLFSMISGFLPPTAGHIRYHAADITGQPPHKLARRGIARTFQRLEVFGSLTARENIQVPLELRGEEATARARADELLDRVGLGGRGHHYPAQLSGGQQQRVALARAFSHRPRILFADEPTGNLDASTGATVIALMSGLNRELGTTLVLVTHDPDLAARARRIIRLADGAVVHDSAAA